MNHYSNWGNPQTSPKGFSSFLGLKTTVTTLDLFSVPQLISKVILFLEGLGRGYWKLENFQIIRKSMSQNSKWPLGKKRLKQRRASIFNLLS